jgi:hypothetical protein
MMTIFRKRLNELKQNLSSEEHPIQYNQDEIIENLDQAKAPE